MAGTPATVTAPVKSALLSKINWMQVASLISIGLVLLFGPKAELSPETQAVLAAALPAICNVVTIVLRTWFTRSITAAAVAK